MLFGRCRQKGVAREFAPYANFVVKKVIPSLSTQRDVILDTARKIFLKGKYESDAERALIITVTQPRRRCQRKHVDLYWLST